PPTHAPPTVGVAGYHVGNRTGSAGGCFHPSSNQCQSGNTSSHCGAPGGSCFSCVGNTAGTQCINGNSSSAACGCTSREFCPMSSGLAQACNVSVGQCTSLCSNAQTCNGGGCDPVTGHCAAGNTNAKCGY